MTIDVGEIPKPSNSGFKMTPLMWAAGAGGVLGLVVFISRQSRPVGQSPDQQMLAPSIPMFLTSIQDMLNNVQGSVDTGFVDVTTGVESGFAAQKQLTIEQGAALSEVIGNLQELTVDQRKLLSRQLRSIRQDQAIGFQAIQSGLNVTREQAIDIAENVGQLRTMIAESGLNHRQQTVMLEQIVEKDPVNQAELLANIYRAGGIGAQKTKSKKALFKRYNQYLAELKALQT